MCLGPNEWGTECGHCYKCTVTGRIPSQPSIPEPPVPLNIGSLWRRKQDGLVVTIRAVESRYPRHVGLVRYTTGHGGGYCQVSRWHEKYEPAPITDKECGIRPIGTDFAEIESRVVGALQYAVTLARKPKPPRGVKPRNIHDAERANALVKAIDRYLREDLPIPLEWVVEYNELHGRLNKQGV